MENNRQESWHLSKSVPVTLIFALVIQAAAIVWTVSTMSADIAIGEERIMEESVERKLSYTHLDTRINSLEKDDKDQAVLLARMDENIKNIIKILDSIAERDKT